MGTIVDAIEKFLSVPDKEKPQYMIDATPRFEADTTDGVSDIDPIKPAEPKQLPSVQELLKEIVENTKLSRERDEPFFLQYSVSFGDTNNDSFVETTIHSAIPARYIFIPDFGINNISIYMGEGRSFKIGNTTAGQGFYAELPRPISALTFYGEMIYNNVNIVAYFSSDPFNIHMFGNATGLAPSSATNAKTLSAANTDYFVNNAVNTPNWIVKRRAGSGTAYLSVYSGHNLAYSIAIPDSPNYLAFRCTSGLTFWTTDATTANVIEYMQSS